MLRLFTALLLLTSVDTVASADSDWLPASKTAIATDEWRRHALRRFLDVELDLDADGRLDRAELVVSADGSRSAVSVCLSSRAPEACRRVLELPNEADVMGLDRIAPGCHAYRSIDGSADSVPGEICHAGDALSYFRFASAGSFLVFDPKTSEFVRYWDSD